MQGTLALLDELDRIRAGVFSVILVSVKSTSRSSSSTTFSNTAPNRTPEDLRFALGGEIDRFRVAAALDIEDAVVAPAVLVIADEVPFRIGGECVLPCR